MNEQVKLYDIMEVHDAMLAFNEHAARHNSLLRRKEMAVLNLDQINEELSTSSRELAKANTALKAARDK